MIKHLIYGFLQILDGFVRFVRQGIACRAPPNQFLVSGIEHINNECTDLIVFDPRGRRRQILPIANRESYHRRFAVWADRG